MPVVRLDRQVKIPGKYPRKCMKIQFWTNGHEAHWDFIHHDGAAAVLPVDADGKILMVRQYRNALNRYTLEIPWQESWMPRMSQRSNALTENWKRKLVFVLKSWNI